MAFPTKQMPRQQQSGYPWSPSSVASEDTEVTLPTNSELEHAQEFLMTEMAKHDDIRFVSYRTAAKLRTLQKQTYLHHIDIWNVIEAFRENGLQNVDPSSKLTEDNVHQLLSSLYDNLQKRLPPPPPTSTGTQGSTSSSSSATAAGTSAATPASLPINSVMQTKVNLLTSFLWRALAPNESTERVKVRAVKAALATLCTGKLMDKLRYLFSQLSDANGHLIHGRFQSFLKDIMKIPMALGEYTAFQRKEVTEVVFDPRNRVTLNDFLETMMSDPGPQCLSWLLVLHRLINSENVLHSVTCGGCLSQGFVGLRYKSESSNYHLCQNCFWRGNISSAHINDVFKEYNSFKTPVSRASIKKSLHCIPSDPKRPPSSSSKGAGPIPRFAEEPERPLDLSNLVPPTSAGYSGHYRSSSESTMMANDYNNDDEHALIAKYANQLATRTTHSHSSLPRREKGGGSHKSLHHSRQIIKDLERRNREIMQDIDQLKQTRDFDDEYPRRQGLGSQSDLVSELSHLRSHKSELDDRLAELQNTRQELMNELEELMKLLQGHKVSPNNDLGYLDQSGNVVFRTPLYE